jgi:hypothetical protein
MLDPSFSSVEISLNATVLEKGVYTREEKGGSEIEYYVSTSNIDEARNIFPGFNK